MTKRMTRIGLGVAAVALTVGLGAAAFEAAGQVPGGQGGPAIGRRGGPGGPGPGRMGGPGRGGPMGAPGLPLRELGLSDAQREQVQAINESHRDEMTALRDRAAAARSALHEASIAGTFDEGLVRTRAAEAAAVESDMAVMHARIFSEIHQILTPEQQAKLKEIQAGRQQRMAERRGDMQQRRQR